MKPTRLFLAVVAFGIGVGLSKGWADDIASVPSTAPSSPAAVRPEGQPSTLIQKIQQAPNPSAAVQSYAAAQATSPGDLQTEKAYVRRMAELGVPEMADAQAQDLIKRSPDGMAWAVTAYNSAKRDEMSRAVSDAAMAVRLAPEDPFVQRTAGQVVAWYDKSPDRAKEPADTRTAAESIRTQMAGREVYAAAYLAAVSEYAKSPQGQPTSIDAQPAVAQPPVTQPVPSAAAYYDDGGDRYVVAAPDYSYTPPPPVYTDYYYGYRGGWGYPYWWGGSLWGGGWWWPSYGSVVIINRDCDFKKGHGGNNNCDAAPFRHRGNFNNTRGTSAQGTVARSAAPRQSTAANVTGKSGGFVHGGPKVASSSSPNRWSSRVSSGSAGFVTRDRQSIAAPRTDAGVRQANIGTPRTSGSSPAIRAATPAGAKLNRGSAASPSPSRISPSGPGRSAQSATMRPSSPSQGRGVGSISSSRSGPRGGGGSAISRSSSGPGGGRSTGGGHGRR